MKYCIQHRVGKYKHAGSKAVRDVISIAHSLDYKTFNIYRRFYHYGWSIVKLFFTLKKQDEVLLQWPFYYVSTTPVVKILLNKKIRLTLLIHDINSLRKKARDMNEDTLLNYAQTIIVHTEAMKEYLIKRGIAASKLVVLTSFDYLTEETIPQREYSHTIVFAGNLEKSGFLHKIPRNCFGVKFHCYGLHVGTLPQNLSYCGAFSPENVTALQGSWGLVWDGDSVDTCDGVYGDYLRMNSPHKLSLYIVSGLPVIVWADSALAGYVKEKNLGITINSMRDLNTVLNNISNNKYKAMLDAIHKEAQELKNGAHLKKSLI